MDFQKGDIEGIVRLEKEGSAQKAVDLIPEKALVVGEGKVIDLEVLSGADEEAYLATIAEKRNLKRKHPGSGGRGRGRGRPRGRAAKRRRY